MIAPVNRRKPAPSTREPRQAVPPSGSRSAKDRYREVSDGGVSETAANLGRYLNDRPMRGGTTEMVTAALRGAILDGALVPGEWLRESDLAQRLQVSRTPVREALTRLADEGLTVKAPHQGTVVASPTLEDVLAVYVVREHLEGVAARLATGRRSDEIVRRLEESLERLALASEANDVMRCRDENLVFHGLIRQAAGNPYLNRFLTQTENAVRRLPASTFVVPGRGSSAIEEHRQIVRGIQTGDADLAESAARGHMRAAREIRIKMMLGE